MNNNRLHCSQESHESTASFLHLSNEPNDVILCDDCVIDRAFLKGSLICVKDCILNIGNNREKIVNNWPPGIDPLHTVKLREYSKKNYK